MDPILRLIDLEVCYGDFKLGPLNLEVPRGAILGYIGQSGSGKTSTIKAILGLKKPARGRVEVLSEEMDPNAYSQYGKIGIVFDQLYLPENTFVYEVEKMGASLYKEWNREKFWTYCNGAGLSQNKKIEELSKGMRAKLAFFMALSHNPDLLILDEPTSGLDPASREEFLDLVLDFVQDPRHSVLISSHILSDLEKVADYIGFIHEGDFLFMEETNILHDKYGIWKGPQKEFEGLDPDSVVRYRDHSFGVEALVLQERYRGAKDLDFASLEEIMVFYLRGKKLEN